MPTQFHTAPACPFLAVLKFERAVREIPMHSVEEAERFIANALAGPQKMRIVGTAVVPVPPMRFSRAAQAA